MKRSFRACLLKIILNLSTTKLSMTALRHLLSNFRSSAFSSSHCLSSSTQFHCMASACVLFCSTNTHCLQCFCFLCTLIFICISEHYFVTCSVFFSAFITSLQRFDMTLLYLLSLLCLNCMFSLWVTFKVLYIWCISVLRFFCVNNGIMYLLWLLKQKVSGYSVTCLLHFITQDMFETSLINWEFSNTVSVIVSTSWGNNAVTIWGLWALWLFWCSLFFPY